MQRLDRQGHSRFPRIIHQFGDGIFHLRPRCPDIFGRRASRARLLRQSAGHQYDARCLQRLGFIDGPAVIIAHFDPMRGV
jgi:hypothetical protein